MTDRLLIIDDDVRLADMLREYLAMSGAVVEARASGQGGLDAVAQAGRIGAPYDVVILDVMLPRPRRLRDLPPAARGVRHSDPDAHRARRGDRPHRRP